MVPRITWAMHLAVLAAVAAMVAMAPAAERSSRRRNKKPAKPPAKGVKTAKGGPKRLEKAPNVYELMKRYEARQYNSVYGALPYRLLKPQGYVPSRRYPLVVCLHGVPGRGKDNALQLGCTVPAAVLARPDMQKRYPAFVMAPQSPTWWGDAPYGTKPTPGGRMSKKSPPMMSMLLDGIEALTGVFGIDPNRVYVTGHSMGGFGAFNALRSDPNMFAAAVIAGGGGDPNEAYRYRHVPVWVFCGAKSPILHYSQNMVLGIKKVMGKVNFTVIPDAAHQCWSQVYDSQATWDWLFAQRRVWPRPVLTTWPTTVPATLPATRPSASPRE